MSLPAPPLVQLNTQPPPVVAAQPQAPAQRPLSMTTTTATTNNAQPTPVPRSAFQRAKHRLKVLLGYAGTRRAQRDRQEIVRLVCLLAYSLVQVVVVLTLTIIGAKTASPRPNDDQDLPAQNPSPPPSELSACSLLGAWNLLWLGKLFVWGYLDIWVLLYVRRVRAARRLTRRQQRASRAEIPPLEFPPGAQQPGQNGANGNAVPEEGEPAVERHEICPLTWTSLHLFLWKADPVVTVVWFFSTVLVSWPRGSRCHEFAKDIATASIVLLLMVYVQYVVTVLLPTIRVLMARRRANQPLVAKLSKRDVDRIPLVLYIPPPPTDTPASPISPLPRSVTHPTPTPSAQPPPPPSAKRCRFISFRPSFRRRNTKADIADVEQGGADVLSPIDEEGDEWDRTWERGSYPFVRLPENRATCMICLSEFEAPRRVSERERALQPTGTLVPEGNVFEMRPLSSPTAPDVEEVRVESPRDADARTIELADTGGSDAPQPLRLLSCGHVYHKECVDPWLIQKSGRCPYCSARVEVPPAPERRNSIWRRGTV